MPGTDVSGWVYAGLCSWANKNGDVQVCKIKNEITLRRISSGEIIGVVLVNGCTEQSVTEGGPVV